MSLTYINELPINVVKRAKRRSSSIQITPDNTITIIAPWHTSLGQITKMIESKEKWIRKKLTENNERPKATITPLTHNSLFPYLGKHYTLQLVAGPSQIMLNNHHLTLQHPQALSLSRHKKQALLEKWLKEMATDIITDRVDYYAQTMKVTPNSIRFKKQKTRWGSCSSAGNLNFNWQLIMASMHVIDYIVVHELCHLVHHNHSKQFWNLVEDIYPDYKAPHQWLKTNGHHLTLTDPHSPLHP